jgi:ATP-dependent 26S proteasome regulatory subunit
MVKRAGLPLPFPENVELGATDAKKRRDMVEERQRWEATTATSNAVARSALSRRAESSSKPDLFLGDMDRRLDPQSVAEDKTQLQVIMQQGNQCWPLSAAALADTDKDLIAQARISELVARAGAGNAFEGEKLGIGGLDDVLSQVKRRVWTPLAAPPKLLKELGISPVRGLLLYGRPGCVR